MDINASIRKLALLFVTLFIAISAGLVYWQVVVAQQVTSNPHNSRVYLASNAPVRGKIFDRKGRLLAESQPAPNGGYIRHYTEPSLAGVIGYYVQGFQATGLEAQYDDYLSGRKGLTALDNTINKTLHRPPVGDDLYLTIDLDIQRIADKHFDDPIVIDNVNTFASDRGSVIITDPHSGAILAMVSRPYFDPNKMVQTLSNNDLSYYNQLNTDKEKPLLERPIQEKYIPGSTYKTMTLVAGLDSGHTTLSQQFDKQHALGPVYYNGHPTGPEGNNIEHYTFHFPVNTEYAFTHSDNVIFAQIGVNTGFDTWMDYNNRFYVGKQVPFDLPVVPTTVLQKPGQKLDDNELAQNSFGQGYDSVTPMHMSLLDDAVANDGQLMRPRLVQRIEDNNHTLIDRFDQQPLGSQQMSSDTAKRVRQAMFGVVQCGSGSLNTVKLGTSPWTIIGKTGTAEVGGGLGANSWLITQAPYTSNNPSQLPKLTIMAMKENGGEGGAAVGPMITNMYNDIFSTIDGYKTQVSPPPPSNYCYTTQLLQ